MFPGDALRIGDPMLFAAGVAARRLAFIEDRCVGGLRAGLELAELLFGIGLEAQMVHTRLAAARGDREVDPRILEHPLCVVTFEPGRLGREHL